MTTAHLASAAFGFGMLGFLLGFLKGRRDLRVDLDPLVEELHNAVRDIPTACPRCDAPLKAACSRGCVSEVGRAP